MASKLQKMLGLVDKMPPGSQLNVRGLDAEITAYGDEHVFLTVKEAMIDPEDIDVAAKVVRDHEIENLKREVRNLREEVRRILSDSRYREDRVARERYELDRMDRMRDSFNVMDYMRGPLKPISYGGEMPGAPAFIDELAFKLPSQQKRKS